MNLLIRNMFAIVCHGRYVDQHVFCSLLIFDAYEIMDASKFEQSVAGGRGRGYANQAEVGVGSVSRRR